MTNPETSAAPTAHRQLVVFSMAGAPYALPIAAVREIIRYTEPRYVPSRIEGMEGVINLRGELIAIYDLAPRLGLATPRLGGSNNIVIVAGETGSAGIVVD